MASTSKTVRIFISSPGDVAAEREQARRVIDGLRHHYVDVTLQTVFWEDLALVATASFQESIDFLLNQVSIDVAVFILWSRLGTPLGSAIRRRDGSPYQSGTEREFDLMLTAFEASGRQRPQILAYTRQDDTGFQQRLEASPPTVLDEVLSQRKLAESFIKEQFCDAEGRNIRAYHTYQEPVGFAQRLHSHLRQLLDHLCGIGETPRWLEEPYRGFEPFDLQHALIFQGRDEETVEVLQRLRDRLKAGCAFVVIVGASGSGKSSLARAGVAAALTQFAFDPGIREWRVGVLTASQFGGDLILGLVKTLISVLPEWCPQGTSQEELAMGFKASPGAEIPRLVAACDHESARVRGQVRVLLLLDQMEELWTDSRISQADRQRFLDLIEGLARCGPISVLATLRSDFYPRAQEMPVFLRLKGDRGQFDLLPPSPAALKRLITEPARLAGIQFERHERTGRSLDEVILEDAARDPSALPLLQYALSELYLQRDVARRMMTFAAYYQMAGIEGAVGRQARKISADLPTQTRSVLNELLPLLVTIDVGGDLSEVRRRALLSDMQSTPARQQLTARFIEARFLTTDHEQGAPVVSLAHEALLRSWDDVAQWVQVNREHLRLRVRVEQLQRRWEQSEGNPSLYLPQGLMLEEGRQVLHGAVHLLSSRTVKYIAASIDFHEQAARRRRRIRRAVIAALCLLTLSACIGGTYAWFQSEEATFQRGQAISAATSATESAERATKAAGVARTEAARARAAEKKASDTADELRLANDGLVSANRTLKSIAYSGQLYKASTLVDGDSQTALSILYNPALCPMEEREVTWGLLHRICHRELGSLADYHQRVSQVAFSPDGSTLALAGWDETIRLWDVVQGRERAVLKERALSIAFSPDGRLLASGSATITLRNAETGEVVAKLAGHQSGVVSLDFSPDGRTLVSSSVDNTVRFWDVDAQMLSTTLPPFAREVRCVRFSPNGKTIAGACFDGLIRLWEVASRREIASWKAHDYGTRSLAYSPDGKSLVSCGGDKLVKLWDVERQEIQTTMSGHSLTVESVAFSADGQTIASAGAENVVRLWNASTGRERAVLRGHVGDIASIAYSPDGQTLVSAGEFGTYDWGEVKLWNAAAHHERIVIPTNTYVQQIVCSSDGQTVATVESDHSVSLWDPAQGTIRQVLPAQDSDVTGIEFFPDSRSLVTATRNGTMNLWDAHAGRLLATFAREVKNINSLAVTPDGLTIATASDDRFVRLWDVTGRRVKAQLAGHTGEVTHVAINAAGTTIVSASADRTIKVWDIANQALLKSLKGHARGVRQVRFSPDGNTVVSFDYDNVAMFWDVPSGKERATLADKVFAFAFTPDGRTVATANATVIQLWDTQSIRERASFAGVGKFVSSLAFSPDGRTLVSGNQDQTISFWNVLGGLEERTLAGHSLAVNSVAFTSDGKLLASASGDETIKLWDATHGRERGTLAGHTDVVRSIVFSHDTKTLLSGSDDQTVKLWDVASGTERATLRGFTQPITAVTMSPDDQLIASSTEDEITIWDAGTLEKRTTMKVPSASWGTAIAFTPDGRTIASRAGGDQSISYLDVASGKVVRVYETDNSTLNGNYVLAISPDGTTLVAESASESATVWDGITGRVRKSFLRQPGMITSMAFSTDGHLLAAGDLRGTIAFWDMGASRLDRVVWGHSDSVQSVAFSPGRRIVASGSQDHTVKLWNLDELQQRQERDRQRQLPWNTGEWVRAERQGRWFSACALSHPLVHAFPRNADYRRRRGTAYAQLGWWKQAILELQKAIELTPTGFEPRGDLAIALIADGQNEVLHTEWAAWLNEFAKSQDGAILNSLARTRLSWPITDPSELAQVRNWATAGTRRQRYTAQHQEVVGAARLREGKTEAALNALLQAALWQVTSDPSEVPSVFDDVLGNGTENLFTPGAPIVTRSWKKRLPTLWTRLHLSLALYQANELESAKRVAETIPGAEIEIANWKDRLIWRSLYPQIQEKLGLGTPAQ